MATLLAIGWSLAVLASFPLIYLAVEIICGIAPIRNDETPRTDARSVVLIPAHNEEAGIAATIREARKTLPVNCSILVVADNCTDATAQVARDAGAEVAERYDPQHRGKGHALAHGREYLRAIPPEVVIVLDADCRLAPESAERLVNRVMATGAPVQASNLVYSPPGAGPLEQISNFAMLVKNLVRARGLQRIAGGSLLFGTGMAFPWPVFSSAVLATADVVEDLRLGIALARGGIRASLDEHARVSSEAAAAVDAVGQRRRWEHGFLRIAAHNAVPLFLEGLKTRSRHKTVLGLHLMIPPLALLFVIAGLALALVLGLAAMTGEAGPAILTGVCLAIATMAVLLAWFTNGRALLSATTLLFVPFYAAWKLPIYAGFLIARQTGWNRTRRASESASSDPRS